MKKQSVGDIDVCTFCSVKMFGTGAYTGDNGETVYFDYVKPENLNEFCRKHCSKFTDKIRQIVNRMPKNEDIPEIYISNSTFDRAVEEEMIRIIKNKEELFEILNNKNK